MPIGFNHNTFNVNAQEESTQEIGSIYGSARSSTPSGYLLCDGSAVSRTTYARLFTAIGTSFGIGDGSTTFNLPDGRGGTLRGVGTSSGYTQNVTITLGTKQNDSFQGHFHEGSSPVEGGGYGTGPFSTASYRGGATYVTSPRDDGTSGTPRTASETRMKNIGVNFYIKF